MREFSSENGGHSVREHVENGGHSVRATCEKIKGGHSVRGGLKMGVNVAAHPRHVFLGSAPPPGLIRFSRSLSA